ncbi:MAG TPA: hypothetical protein VL337_03835 [Acidimicrobiales bacterium]|jgi:hypothetical protein|nr:hypothetical protein [Acidimicrobiales bacterium]
MVESNGSHPVNPSQSNGGQSNGSQLPTSLDDFLSDDEWRDLRAGLRDLAQVRARSEAAAAHIRI